MQTIIRNGKAYDEYSPQELEAMRLEETMNRMQRTGNFKSSHGAIDSSEFVSDHGHRKNRHKAHG